MDNPEVITVLSLCAGYCGLELGLARALANPLRVVAVEVEAYALANLVAKAEEGKLAIEALWPDLRTFPAHRFRGCFDFVIAGYPCQPFSHAGKRKGAEDPRHLWPHIARIIEAVRPVWGFFENVPGHLSLGFPEVYRSLRDMGYSVEAGLFTAAEVGAPHKRQRLFVLARRMENAGNHEQSPNERYLTEVSALSQAERESEHSATVFGRTSIEGGSDKLPVPECPEPGLRIRQEPEGPALTLRPTDEHGRTLWPARPGQPQYEWEEPRVVVGNAESDDKRRNALPGKNGKGKPARRSGGGMENASKRRRIQSPQAQKRGEDRRTLDTSRPGQAQSGVGLSTDGPVKRLGRASCHVDELRLLGNGVVPQQAEKALRMLMHEQGVLF